jgi:Holliday junction resolvase RusA-like endonuclease
MHIEFRFANTSNKTKANFHTKKPDWDNIGKIVSDSLNDILYDDDKQLWDVRVIKKFNDINKDQIHVSFKYSKPGDSGKVLKLSYSK